MIIDIQNAQKKHRVPITLLRKVAEHVVDRRPYRVAGTICITFIGPQRMRAINRRFKHHDWNTDVLSFRYGKNSESVIVGEILIAPSAAKGYARKFNISYQQELARYLVHGLLHWSGYKDSTREEQLKMRREENRHLNACGLLEPIS